MPGTAITFISFFESMFVFYLIKKDGCINYSKINICLAIIFIGFLTFEAKSSLCCIQYFIHCGHVVFLYFTTGRPYLYCTTTLLTEAKALLGFPI